MKLKLLLVVIQFFGVLVGVNHQALFIFQEYKPSFSTDIAGMNVAHQLFACLHQKAAPVLISQNIWEHILIRKQRFDKALALGSSLQSDVIKLINTVNNALSSGIPLQDINQTMNQNWYATKYPRIAGLSEEKYKEIMFDFLCSHLFEFVQNWSVYCIDDYILFVVSEDQNSFNLVDAQKVSDITKLELNNSSQEQFNMLIVLSKILKKEILWSFYISGHGDHASKTEKIETIVGMHLSQFKKFIFFLENSIHTNLLMYSSCYGSGINLMEPYQNMAHYKNLSFAIITTCLTDAPVYVYGSASGLVLPAYDKNIFLQETNVENKHLAWNFIQDFSQFKKYALDKQKYIELAQAIMPYKECIGSVCNLSQLENIPLIKRPKEIFFVPLDSAYIDFIIHNESSIKKVENKSGLLWYIKQYKGTIQIINSLPQFVNMIPGDGVIWTQKLQADAFNVQDMISKLFFSIEDMYGVKVFIFDAIECFDNDIQNIGLLKNCMVIPKSSWIPKDWIRKDQIGVCFYQKDKDWYCLTITGNQGKVIYEKIPNHKVITLKKLWKLLRKESQSYAMLDALDLVLTYKKRQESYLEILKLCQAEKICS